MVLAVFVVKRLGTEAAVWNLSHEIFGIFKEPPQRGWGIRTTWKAAGASHYCNGLPQWSGSRFRIAAHGDGCVESIKGQSWKIKSFA